MMQKLSLTLGLAVLAAAACGYPPIPELADGAASPPDTGPPPDAGPPPIVNLELLAGGIGGDGNLDGVGAAARFSRPVDVAVDSAGNIYVADNSNHTIRKVTAAGVVTTLAGTAGAAGSTNGIGAAARFFLPMGVAVDSAGNVYVADTNNHIIRKLTADGVVTTLAGTAGTLGSADGIGAAARFRFPVGVAVDSTGNVYVADEENQTIRKVTAVGVVTTLAGAAGTSGSTDGAGAAARFNRPADVALDSAGNVYVADEMNHTIRKVTPLGVVTTLAGTAGTIGSTDGTGAAARFSFPAGVAVDSAGNVYVGGNSNHTIRKVTDVGVVTTLAGTAGAAGSTDGIGAAARFHFPGGVAVDSTGIVYVADKSNDTIRKVTAAGVVTTLASTPRATGSTDGPGATARFLLTAGVAVDSTGNVYVAEFGNNTIRKVTAGGVVTTVAGTAGTSGSTDGTRAAARFRDPVGLAVDSTGNIYVADQGNDTIRKVTPLGVVTTLAGTAGMSGSTDGTGAAARFRNPVDVAVDGVGNIYVADQGNYTIRKVTPLGVVTTLAGTAGRPGSTDGTGAAARFFSSEGVAVDSTGNIYVADTGNNTIRKVTAAGVVTTVAGTAGTSGSTDGTGAAARFFLPTGVTVDSAGNIYVAEEKNSTIRRITATGITTTIAGVAGMRGILLGATPRFAAPDYLAIIGDSIVISDGDAILLLRVGAR